MSKRKGRGTAQPRIPGIRRESKGTGLLPAIEARVQRDADRYGVSPSWVRATILAQYYHIKDQPDFKEGK